jgi:uncharacterized membrane protein YdbT with pleckstrin-like domain
MEQTAKPRITNPTEEIKKRLAALPVHGIFSAFIPSPKNVKFENQEAEEKLIILLRRHAITNFSWILITAILIAAPFFYQFFPLFDFLPKHYLPILFLGWYLLIVAFAFENFLLWFYNIYIITDERVIDVDFYHILYKEISDAKIDKIQDVSYNQRGIFQAMFNYGDILIQTAAEKTQFVFEKIPNPDQVVSVINLLLAEEQQEVIEGRIR